MPGSYAHKERPPYAIKSVDAALQLAALIQLEGGITTKRAAERLNVAHSTAHRMLAMLVYRDFAVKDGSIYRTGPILQGSSGDAAPVALLREVSASPMTGLDDQFDETTTLTIRTGRTVRILAEIECSHQLRVGHRTGMAKSAHESTAGIMLLALLSDEEIRDLYASGAGSGEADEPDIERIYELVAKARENGFFLDSGATIKGIVSIACPVIAPNGEAIAALTVSMPASRYNPAELRTIVGGIRSAARQIELELLLNVRKQSVGHVDAQGFREQLVV